MENIEAYQKSFISYLEDFVVDKEPNNLYEPINYILKLGGKRLRPVLTLMTTERGKETVHEKWDINTGILSGDAMLILAYQLFENYESHTFQALAKLFSKTALEVCEGQQYDVDFETRNDVTISEYLKMIEYKTFQLQDDYLDAFGNPETFGKQVGGDILENKKTYLYLKTLELGAPMEQSSLVETTSSNSISDEVKVESVKNLFSTSGDAEATQNAVKDYTNKAFEVLKTLNISEDKKQLLRLFGEQLMNRRV